MMSRLRDERRDGEGRLVEVAQIWDADDVRLVAAGYGEHVNEDEIDLILSIFKDTCDKEEGMTFTTLDVCFVEVMKFKLMQSEAEKC
jgi:hypothetical protein